MTGLLIKGSFLSVCYHHHILTEGFEALAVLLYNGDGDMARFAGVDIPHGARLPPMRAPGNGTVVAVH